jgi:hypothetical protein
MVAVRHPVIPTGAQWAADHRLEVLYPMRTGLGELSLVRLQALKDAAAAWLHISAERPGFFRTRHLLLRRSFGWNHSRRKTKRHGSEHDQLPTPLHGYSSSPAHSR